MQIPLKKISIVIFQFEYDKQKWFNSICFHVHFWIHIENNQFINWKFHKNQHNLYVNGKCVAVGVVYQATDATITYTKIIPDLMTASDVNVTVLCCFFFRLDC